MIGVFKTNIKVGKVDADKTRDKPAHRAEKIHFKCSYPQKNSCTVKSSLCPHGFSDEKEISMSKSIASTSSLIFYGIGNLSPAIKSNFLGAPIFYYYNNVLGLDALLVSLALAFAKDTEATNVHSFRDLQSDDISSVGLDLL